MDTYFEQRGKFVQKRRQGKVIKERTVRLVFERFGSSVNPGPISGVIFEERSFDTMGGESWTVIAKMDAPTKGGQGDGVIPKGVGSKLIFDAFAHLAKCELAES